MQMNLRNLICNLKEVDDGQVSVAPTTIFNEIENIYKDCKEKALIHNGRSDNGQRSPELATRFLQILLIVHFVI